MLLECVRPAAAQRRLLPFVTFPANLFETQPFETQPFVTRPSCFTPPKSGQMNTSRNAREPSSSPLIPNMPGNPLLTGVPYRKRMPASLATSIC